MIESRNVNPLVDSSDSLIILVKDQESNQTRHYKNQRSQQPFSLGVWCEYAEKEYDLLILSEQCSSVDSDWSVRNNELEEEEEEQEEEEEEENIINRVVIENENNVTKDQMLTIGTLHHREDVELRSSDEEIESPMQESSDDHESDSSAPSTPVMQDSANDDKWLKDESRKVIDDQSSWIWHSTVNSE